MLTLINSKKSPKMLEFMAIFGDFNLKSAFTYQTEAIMKKFTKLTTALAAALLLTSCGTAEPNSLFDTASPESSIMAIYVCDGAEVTCYWLSDNALEWEIVNQMKNTSATPAEVTTDDVTFPAYGFELGSTDGWGLNMAWSNGYLYNRDGEVYEFDFDFEKILDDYGFEEKWTRSGGLVLPCVRYLVQDENGWNAELMTPALEAEVEPNPNIRITVDVDYTGGTIEAEFRNDGTEAWGFGTYWSLQVNLDGEWYEVPPSPVSNWGFPDIGYELAPGKTWDETYSMEMYGDLPAGQYRFYAFGMTDEFTIAK